jgi:putative oxygen-independent coproporphyrinogen III oxidase
VKPSKPQQSSLMSHSPYAWPHALAVYLHWPWCKKKCPYCDFNSHTTQPGKQLDDLAKPYSLAVLNELTQWKRWLQAEAARQGQAHAIVSVFMGGGTPSLMPASMVAEWVAAAKALGTAGADCEVTLECNPTSLTDKDARQYFKTLREAGVNRVSIGVQALQDDVLGFLGREHNVQQALASLDAALVEIPRVSADVIYGVPGQHLDDWQRDLRFLAGLGLRHISAYQLTIEPHTHFAAAVRQGHWQPVEIDIEADFFEATQAVLGEAGLTAYEISNFAAADEACRHNLHVWRYGVYVGAGAGAHGRVALNEEWLATKGVRAPEQYQHLWQESHNPAAHTTWASWKSLNPEEALQEVLLMGLRLREGIYLRTYPKHIQQGLNEAVDWAGVKLCQSMGWLKVEGDHWRLTDAGWPRLNGVLGQVLRTV